MRHRFPHSNDVSSPSLLPEHTHAPTPSPAPGSFPQPSAQPSAQPQPPSDLFFLRVRRRPLCQLGSGIAIVGGYIYSLAKGREKTMAAKAKAKELEESATKEA